MGLLDGMETDPHVAMGMGLLAAGGNSRMPVSLGQGLASGYGEMQKTSKEAQALAMQKLQMSALLRRQYMVDSAMAQENGQPPPRPEHYGLPPEMAPQQPQMGAGGPMGAPPMSAPQADGAMPQNPGSPQQWTPGKISAFAMSGDPGLGKAAELAQARLLKSQDAVVNRGFGIGTMVNGKYVPDPASLEQAISLEKAKQGIELPYRAPVTLDTSSGQKASVFPSEFPQVQQGGIPSRLTGQPQATADLVGDPKQIIGLINQIQDPKERVAALDAYARQLSGPKPMQTGVGTVGLSQPQADQINQERQRAGGKAVDEGFAKDYVSWTQGGGADAAKQLAQLQDVKQALADPKAKLTGPTLGMLPDSVKNFVAPQSVAMQERVAEVVQRSLRSILGAQFTENEGVRLIARAYNPSQPESENAIRVGRLFTQLEQAFKAKQDAAQYFEKNGTLQGWGGKLYNMSDFDSAVSASPSSGDTQKTASMDDIVATAKASGKTTAEVTAALKSKGYIIK